MQEEKNDNSEFYYNQGNLSLDNGDYTKAIEYFTEAISLNPKYSEAYFGRACSWQLKNDLKNAFDDYSITIELQPDFVNAYNNRGILLKNKGDYNSAILDFTKVIELQPDLDAYLNRGNLYLSLSNDDLAILDFTKAIELQPNLASAYNNRGCSLRNKGYWDLAILDFTKAIELQTDQDIFYYNRGNSCFLKKEYKKAIDDFSKAILLNVENAQAFAQLGCSLYYIKEFDDSIEKLTKAISLNPNFSEAFNIRGQAQYEKMNFDKAFNDCSKAISLNPKLQEAYVNRGNILHSMHRNKEAIDDFSEAIKLRPEDDIAYFDRGNSWYSTKKYIEAMADYSQIIIINPEHSGAFEGRGNCWDSLKIYHKAIEDYTKAIDLESNNPITYNNRGNSWKGLKEFDKAKNDYTKAIALQSDFAAPYFNLYSLFIESNKTIALYNLNRANYLNLDRIILLIQAYHNTFLLPFMLLRVFNKLSLAQPLKSLLNTYSENHPYCENWEMFLDLIKYNYFDNDLLIKKLRLKALVNYFMGDCIETFSIYDEEIDTLESETLTLRDQYYYIKSAQEFLEPHEGILHFAIEQAKANGMKSIENKYYTGLIYLLIDDIKNAKSFFIDAAESGFRPALYQLAGMYKKTEPDFKNGKKICERIQRLEELNADRYSLLNGIPPLILDEKPDSLINLLDYCKYYAYFAENIEEIELVRNFLEINKPYSKIEFWNIVQLNKDDKEFLKNKVAHYELLEFEQRLFNAFDEFCNTEKEVGFLQKITDNNQALTAYTELKSSIEDEDFKKTNLTYEKALALKIKDMKREQISAKWFLVFTKLLYLKGYLAKKEALCLHLYAQKIAIQNKDQSTIEGINLEIEGWFKFMTGIPSPFLTKLTFKTLKFILDGFTFQDSSDNDYSDYLEFKENYYNHLESWKSSLIKEFNLSN